MLRPLATAEAQVENNIGAGAESGEAWSGVEDAEPPPIDHEAEYVDEEKYTVVTVEAIDLSKEGLSMAQPDQDLEPDEHGSKVSARSDKSAAEQQKSPWTKEKPKDSAKKRKKKRNFRYEGKVERKEARSKQKARNSKQARERRADQ